MSNNSSHTIEDVSGINYVIAIIRLPLEIHPDGTFTTLNDNIDFEFIPIKELPTKKENGIEIASIALDGILGLFNKSSFPSPDIIRCDTLSCDSTNHIITSHQFNKSSVRINIDKRMKRIRNKNTTFKNISGTTHNYSTKSWK